MDTRSIQGPHLLMDLHADAEAQAQRAQQYQHGNAVELRELVHQGLRHHLKHILQKS